MSLKWYTLCVCSGFEKYVQRKIVSNKLVDSKSILLSESMPGYLFLKFELTPDLLANFLDVEGTVKFLGKKTISLKKREIIIPEAITKKQILKIFNVENELAEDNEQYDYKINDEIYIKNGDLSGIQGTIVELKKHFVRIKPKNFVNNERLIKVSLKDINYI
jgi:transcription antitermination factor NusG